MHLCRRDAFTHCIKSVHQIASKNAMSQSQISQFWKHQESFKATYSWREVQNHKREGWNPPRPFLATHKSRHGISYSRQLQHQRPTICILKPTPPFHTTEFPNPCVCGRVSVPSHHNPPRPHFPQISLSPVCVRKRVGVSVLTSTSNLPLIRCILSLHPAAVP